MNINDICFETDEAEKFLIQNKRILKSFAERELSVPLVYRTQYKMFKNCLINGNKITG